jgi:hypothetical protein
LADVDGPHHALSLGGALGTGTAGNAENSAMNALNTQDEIVQLEMYSSEIQNLTCSP